MKIKRIHERAIIPTRATEGSVGYDLHCVHSDMLVPYETRLIRTGIVLEMDPKEGVAGIIKERSGLAKKGISVAGGVIDIDYRGEIMVMLRNNNSYPDGSVFITAGDRIAQMVFHRVWLGKLEETMDVGDTERGEKGFGSTGD